MKATSLITYIVLMVFGYLMVVGAIFKSREGNCTWESGYVSSTCQALPALFWPFYIPFKLGQEVYDRW